MVERRIDWWVGMSTTEQDFIQSGEEGSLGVRWDKAGASGGGFQAGGRRARCLDVDL